MEIKVHEKLDGAQTIQQRDHRCTLFHGTASVEGAIGVNRIRVPALENVMLELSRESLSNLSTGNSIVSMQMSVIMPIQKVFNILEWSRSPRGTHKGAPTN